ncbi:hypothetical protein KH5H1_42640 [Corallococcus caeni]|uniref:Uncharacterized protein n=1 Tax=Corallococcus caeni TaxID=3082388 RepID=A0ABQ6QZ30_9BACT|nr:hypothetical protein KH5H1_42640 [Corallococcus sp. KH5-1]GMU09288.1 hypothetical protein ASNO1_55410 [Corallococcus sp. NO1]
MPVPANVADEVHLAVGALARQGVGVHLAALSLQAGKIVVEEDPVQIRDVDPQTATLSTFPQRLVIPFEISHFGVATGAIHGAARSPEGGSTGCSPVNGE